jgi:hypothetical protein
MPEEGHIGWCPISGAVDNNWIIDGQAPRSRWSAQALC